MIHKPNDMQITKKAFCEAVLPFKGEMIDECQVIYVKNNDFSYTASGTTLPEVGKLIEFKGRHYTVARVMQDKSRYEAKFSGFKDFKVPEAPSTETEDVEKLI